MLQDRAEKEIGTAEIGAFVMQELKQLDKVAYVRFASVYRHFRDIGEFMTELKDLLSAKGIARRGDGANGSDAAVCGSLRAPDACRRRARSATTRG